MDNCITIDGIPYTIAADYALGACKMPSKPLTLSGAFEIPRNNYKVGKTEASGNEVYIKEVLYNDPATIVFWSDGTKTVTKCVVEDEYSAEAGLSICILKKLIGGVKVHDIFEDWLPEDSYRVSLRDVREKHK